MFVVSCDLSERVLLGADEPGGNAAKQSRVRDAPGERPFRGVRRKRAQRGDRLGRVDVDELVRVRHEQSIRNPSRFLLPLLGERASCIGIVTLFENAPTETMPTIVRMTMLIAAMVVSRAVSPGRPREPREEAVLVDAR